MAILGQWYGTGVTDPSNLTTSLAGTGDTTFSAVSGATIVFTGGGLVVPSTGSAPLFRKNGLSVTAFAVRFGLKLGATLGLVPLFQALDGSGNIRWSISESSTAQIQLREGTAAGGSAMSNYAGAAGTQYYVECSTNGTTGQIAFRVFDASNNQLHSTTQTIGASAIPVDLVFGRNSSTAAGPNTFSTIKWADAAGIIGPDNLAPNVTLTDPQNVVAASTVSVHADGGDSDGSIASYAWSVISPSTSTPTLTGSTTADLTFTAPAAGGLVTLQCIVTDDDGATDTATTEVRVPVGGATSSRVLAFNGTGTGTWTIAGGSSTDGAALTDESDSTYLESPTVTGTATTKRVRWQPANARATSTIPLRLATDTGTANTSIKLYQGTTLLQTWTQALTTTITTYTLTVSSPTIAAVTDWSNLYIEVGATT